MLEWVSITSPPGPQSSVCEPSSEDSRDQMTAGAKSFQKTPVKMS
jgi:hypothetical protein